MATRAAVYGLLAEFDTPAQLVAAATRAHAEGYRRMDTFSPFPIEEAWEAIGHHDRRLSLIVLIEDVAPEAKDDGVIGEVRLSRDVPQPNRYVFHCAEGWLRWHVHDADHVELGLRIADGAPELTRRGLTHDQPRAANYRFLTTGDPEAFEGVGHRLMGGLVVGVEQFA